MDVVGQMLVGTASVNWGFDPLYTWVIPPSLDDMLDQMAATGYSGTEVSYNFPRDPADVRRRLDARGLLAVSSFVAVDFRDRTNHDKGLREVADAGERLRALGACVLILSDKPSPARLARAGRVALDGSDALDRSSWSAMCEGLNRAGELLAASGMQAAFHPHVGTYVENRAEIDDLCKATDPALVGLCPDSGHLAYAGVSPEEIFTAYASRIKHVHLKDVDADKLRRVRAEGTDFVSAVRMGLFVELGTGIVQMKSILRSLDVAHYAGWLVVEQDAPKDPLVAAARNRAYLRAEFAL